MDIYTYLKKDHQTVADLFEQILSPKNKDKRELLFEEVATELLLHADSENDTFYEALRNHPETEEILQEAEEEHEEVKDYIAKLRSLPIDKEEWIEAFGEMKHAVTHHVKEEEEDIFEKAKKILSTEQAKQIAVDMDELKKKLQKKKS